MLYFVFTIDGDWDEYFNAKLAGEARRPDKCNVPELIDRELALAASTVNGRVLHFVHTSPVAPDDFLRQHYIDRWRKLARQGGSLGVHCHEEDLYQAWHFDDSPRMEKSITFMANSLRQRGFLVKSYRGGFMTFSYKLIPILEKKDIYLDFSCDPGRHLEYNGVLVSDWQGAPDNYYRLSYEDHRKPGSSHVYEVPLGVYIEKQSLWSIWQTVRSLSQKEGLRVLSVLAHTYDFKSRRMRAKLKLALLICRIYGKFINAEEALELVRRGSD